MIQSSRLLASLFEQPVAARETRGSAAADALHAEEAAHVARAAPKRVGEFAAGRACARRALAELGIEDFTLRAGPDREPLWPAGISGSITHTAGFCGVVVARTSALAALGIDAERRDAVHPRLWRQIAVAEEIAWLESLPAERATDMASLLFSAKESFYKCQFALTREWLEFSAVTVSVGPRGFSVRPSRTLALEALHPPPWRGRHALEETLVVTGIGLPPRA